ncbi:MAG: hypothetical protein HC853_10055, partial [Anaerolineae bacterium]|nr:hypothetical protein [Anaerolineae bacterium]
MQHLAEREARLNLSQPEAVLAQRPGWDSETPLSLLNVIRNSEEMLSKPARQAWRALALFEPKPNSFSEAAALAVCGEGTRALDALVDASLIEVNERGRYEVHPVVRDYGRSKLMEEASDIRFVHYFAEWIVTHSKEWTLVELEAESVFAALTLANEAELFGPYMRGSECVLRIFGVAG